MEPMTFCLFGATGDLAKRKIFPALHNLYLNNKLAPSMSIIGLGREELSDIDFREYVKQSVLHATRYVEQKELKITEFLQMFRYRTFEATDKNEYKKLMEMVKQIEGEKEIPENRLFYLSVAPTLFEVIALNIQKSGLSSTQGWKRLIIEKPFGYDLESARELNMKLSKVFHENEMYRLDHYLGKPMVQNLEALEFANPILQALWNNRYISNVQITASEAVGVEKRADYYDQTGALRDMFQNHMLQLFMMTAMHLPKRMDPEEIHYEKRQVLESLRPLQKKNVYLDVVRGQYDSGEIQNQKVVGYRDESGVASASQIETFVAARLWVDNVFWSGVPFYIRTGKRMKEKVTRIVVEFKNSLKGLYTDDNERLVPNLLVIEINPTEGVSLQLNSHDLVTGQEMKPIKMNYSAGQNEIPEAYELLIYDALRGDSTYFAHWDEVELSWQWVQPIVEAFEENQLPLYSYEAGLYGPQAAHRLLQQDGFEWRLDDEPAKTPKLVRQS
ncbi:glucose-6-phosphate dehydrogenase [Bacillus cereus]|uniref:glucose-6-phosphate dehydrogenase n=1 Tax=Bacillus cereus TaxID=1396 RepID=UPI000BF49C2E|nr:glucose-6-phosphate dehydrogenase [Bacillus cereus]PER97239.1 glucose-6-phosphate dehydrogenase [Bacillus cereus]